MFRPALRLALLGVVVYATSQTLPKIPYPSAHPDSPLYAIGDLHGDLSTLILILQACGLVSRDAVEGDPPVWTGGTATLVQTGDVWDRGIHGAAIHEYFDELAISAAEAGGLVVRLLGNHEVLQLNGQAARRSNYVRPAEVERYFASSAWNRTLSFRGDGQFGRALRANFAGAWASRPHRTVFVHGGLTPRILNALGNAAPNVAALLPTSTAHENVRLDLPDDEALGGGASPFSVDDLPDPIQVANGARSPARPQGPALPSRRSAAARGSPELINPKSADAMILSVSASVVAAIRADAFGSASLGGHGPLWDRSMVMDAMDDSCSIADATLEVLRDADVKAHGESRVFPRDKAVGGGGGSGGTLGNLWRTLKEAVSERPTGKPVPPRSPHGNDDGFGASEWSNRWGGVENIDEAILPYARIVVGHTVFRNGIRQMCGGAVVGIDAGMSYAYNGVWKGAIRIDPGGELHVVRVGQ